MKTNKRLLALILACLFCVSAFVGCSGDAGTTPEDTTTADTTTADTTTADTTTPPEDEKWPDVEGTAIYVDVAAEEGGDGSKDAPLRSIQAARDKIREIKASDGLPEGGITVLLASGVYKVTETIDFTEEDSGTAESPIRYMSAEKNGAVLTGGTSIPASEFSPLSDEEKARINDEAAKDKIIKVDLTKYGITSGTDYSIFINDERLFLSRYPNVSAEDPYLRTGLGDKNTNFDILAINEFEAPAIAIKERGKNWDLSSLYAGGYFGNDWNFGTYSLQRFDPETLSITLTSKPYYGIGLLDRFYFCNIFAETDELGEYYIDSNSMTLYVYPPEDFENGSVDIALFSSYMVRGSNLSYVTFDGIDFTLAQSSALVLSKVNNITVENCDLSRIKKDAIYVDGSDITIQNNKIHQIGAHAVAAWGGVLETLTPANILVYNNLMYKWAQVERTYKCAVYMRGCGITASHNEMYDAPHEAIEYRGPLCIIEYNKISNVCQETDDCAAIISGRSYQYYGCVMRYNLIQDIGGNGIGQGRGIYLDDGLSGQTVYGNIIVNTSDCGINIGGGRDNVIENNLFINWAQGEYAIFYDSRARDYAEDKSPDSGVYPDVIQMSKELIELQKQQAWLDTFPGYGDIIPFTDDYSGDMNDTMLAVNASHSIVRNNIACSVNSSPYTKYLFAEWISEEDMQGVYENNIAIQDSDHTFIPGYENGDYTIAEDSEVFATGFVRIPIEEIGRVTNE